MGVQAQAVPTEVMVGATGAAGAPATAAAAATVVVEVVVVVVAETVTGERKSGVGAFCFNRSL